MSERARDVRARATAKSESSRAKAKAKAYVLGRGGAGADDGGGDLGAAQLLRQSFSEAGHVGLAKLEQSEGLFDFSVSSLV